MNPEPILPRWLHQLWLRIRPDLFWWVLAAMLVFLFISDWVHGVPMGWGD